MLADQVESEAAVAELEQRYGNKWLGAVAGAQVACRKSGLSVLELEGIEVRIGSRAFLDMFFNDEEF